MYNICNISFKTQKEVKQYINELFIKNGFGKVRKDTHIFLLELIKRHPEYEKKVGVGIDNFLLSQNPISKQKSYHLSFTRIDGTQDDISYNLCIKGKEITKKTNTLNAMRNAIRNDIKEFKLNAIQKCNVCEIVNVNFDCDHYGKEFKEISENFIDKYGVCNSFKNDSFFTCFDDDEYNEKWIQYHSSNATLQLLCVNCHKEKKVKIC